MAGSNGPQSNHLNAWQNGFVRLLPQIEHLLGFAFRRLDPERKEEAIQRAVVLAMLSFVRLHQRGRAACASASTLTWYAALQVKRGRPAGIRMNSNDPLSSYAQLRRGILARLQTYEPSSETWIDAIVQDRRAPIPDVVAIRLDVLAWLATLGRRARQMAADLARGCTTSEVALKYRVSRGRISQIRRELEDSWNDFQRDAVHERTFVDRRPAKLTAMRTERQLPNEFSSEVPASSAPVP